MQRKTNKAVLAVIAIAFLSLGLSGCDLLQNLLGGGDTENQELLSKLFNAHDKATQEIQAYVQAHNGEGYPDYLPDGFYYSDAGSERTRTFTAYLNADGVQLDGTDIKTFSGTPGASEIVGDNMNIRFRGSIGGDYLLTFKWTMSSPSARNYSECKVNGEDMLDDFLGMEPPAH